MIKKINIVLATSLLLLVVLIGMASAQKQTPPPGGTPKPLRVPESQTFQLANGMKVTLAPFGDVPKVMVTLFVRVGALNEPADHTWLANITGNYLKEGNASLSSEALANTIAQMGGELSVDVDADQTTISSDVLSEFGPQLIQVLAEVVEKPQFPASELERIKKNWLRSLAIEKSQQSSLASERFRQLLYPDHAYGRIFPTEQMLQSLTIEDIKKFYQQNYAAQRSHLYISGVFDAATIKKVIEQAFQSWPAGEPPLINIPKPKSQRIISLIDRPHAEQSTLVIGLPVIDPSHPDYIPLLVTNSLLGGSFASRITSNIREQKGYTYSPYGIVSVRYRDGYWVEVADVTTSVTGPSIKEILYEIDRLRQEAPSEAELQAVKNFLAGIFVLRNSTRLGIIYQLQFVKLHRLDEKYLSSYVDRILAVTPQEVQRMMQTYIKPDKLTIVVAGDREKIADQLTPFGEISK